MKFRLLSAFLLFCLSPFYLSEIIGQSIILFPIKENGRYGFIDQEGRVIVKPKFIAITPFSEGLTAVREKGHYGYIDASGEYVIKPIYDYGEPFQEGKAIVYKDGQPFYINQQGKLLFGKGYAALFAFKDGRAKVKSYNHKFGVVNTSGALIVDTAFYELKLIENGTAIVKGKRGEDENGLLDVDGNFIVPYGRLSHINYLGENRYGVGYLEEDKEGVIDETGQLLFAYEDKGFWIVNHTHLIPFDCSFFDGLAVVAIEGTNSNNKEITYGGYIDVNGEIVIQDTLFDEYEIRPFERGYTIVTTKNREDFIIDKQGKKVDVKLYDELQYDDFRNPMFENGFFVVSKEEKSGIINGRGEYVLAPRDIAIDLLKGGFVFFSKSDKYGIAKLDGTVLLPAILDVFDRKGFQNGLLACRIAEQLAYVNKAGTIVWSEEKLLTEIISSSTKPSIDYKRESDYPIFFTNSIEDNWTTTNNTLTLKFREEVAPYKKNIIPNHEIRVCLINCVKN